MDTVPAAVMTPPPSGSRDDLELRALAYQLAARARVDHRTAYRALRLGTAAIRTHAVRLAIAREFAALGIADDAATKTMGAPPATDRAPTANTKSNHGHRSG